MEEEAAALREMQAKVENQMGAAQGFTLKIQMSILSFLILHELNASLLLISHLYKDFHCESDLYSFEVWIFLEYNLELLVFSK